MIYKNSDRQNRNIKAISKEMAFILASRPKIYVRNNISNCAVSTRRNMVSG